MGCVCAMYVQDTVVAAWVPVLLGSAPALWRREGEVRDMLQAS